MIEVMVRPERFELPTFWFVAVRSYTLNHVFGVSYDLKGPV
jgi:hypothetical protein